MQEGKRIKKDSFGCEGLGLSLFNVLFGEFQNHPKLGEPCSMGLEPLFFWGGFIGGMKGKLPGNFKCFCLTQRSRSMY